MVKDHMDQVFLHIFGSRKRSHNHSRGPGYTPVHSQWWCQAWGSGLAHTGRWGYLTTTIIGKSFLLWSLNPSSAIRWGHFLFCIPWKLTVQTAPGPQGDGSQGSGFSTHLWLWQMYPCWQSGSMIHSGPQPVMVSGLGMRPGSQVQMALPIEEKRKLYWRTLQSILRSDSKTSKTDQIQP